MFEFGGYLFTLSEIVGAFLLLLSLQTLSLVALVFKGRVKTMVSATSENLRLAVVALEEAANVLVSAGSELKSKMVVGVVDDDNEVMQSVARINEIAGVLREQAAKLKE